MSRSIKPVPKTRMRQLTRMRAMKKLRQRVTKTHTLGSVSRI